jgi:hypothetical protein
MNTNYNFAIVEFSEEKNIEVVPVSFLLDKNTKCFWPKKSGPNIRKLLSRNQPIINTKDYDVFGVTVLHLSGKK